MRPRSETRIQLCVSWANAPNKLRLQSRPKWLNGTPAKEGITGCRVMGFKQRWPDDCGRVTLVLFRRRALGGQCGGEQRLGRAFEKAVRRKPLARRTRSLCKLNGVRQRC